MNGLIPSGVSTIIYFGSEDCSLEEKMIPKLGGKIHKAKKSIGQYGFITLAVDTEGNTFGFHSMK
jgi:predicted enzyme related to lactoylglutathione lyase